MGRFIRLVGLGLVVGAVFPSAGQAQQRQPPDSVKARADSLKARADSLAARADSLKARGDTLKAARDSVAAIDSLERENLRIIEAQRKRGDTVKTPTPAAEMPVLTEVGEGLRWNREALFASGAQTLGDLLEGIPGLTIFRSGWMGSPQVGAMIGDFNRLRVFYDGIELDALDPRNGGMLDLSFVQIWQLEEVRVERAAGDIRVHLRSWRVRSTTANTRVDIATGDLETNLYRGYYGRRFGRGEALQLGAYQFSTRDNRGQGDADGLSLFGRVGWARGRFSTDASFLRTARDRTEQQRDETRDGVDLARFDGRFTEAYARAGFADTTVGIWAQVTAASLAHTQNNLAFRDTTIIPFQPTQPDLQFSRTQYVAAAGWGRGPLAASATVRMRRFEGLSFVSPSARASFETSRVTVAAFGEQQDERQRRLLDLSGRVLPISWLAFGAAVGQYTPTGTGAGPTMRTVRGEVGLRLHGAWLTAGVISRDTAQLIAPTVFDTGFVSAATGLTSGQFMSLRGRIWKDVGFNVAGTKWDAAGMYRPQYQSLAELYVNTGWRSRFPSGNFNVKAAISHEYRTAAYFPLADADALPSSQFRTLNFLLEIRLLTATLSYQFRNLLNEQYSQVPGFQMHRPVQVYGVRWQFFN
ncbi:MAG: Plug domain-containing protein [Gemmatimonadaceae bacterium]